MERMSHESRRQRAQPSAQNATQTARAEAFPSEHRHGLLPEKSFRWRAGEITRLEAFCDVVFGFALTLLVVSLEVSRNYEELMSAVRGSFPLPRVSRNWS
jgi:hypothetical protein